ncbi:proline dehydrogenase family protein [Bacillus solimangrovi]|uniref:proline dehydrogenase n=1 Tax=Bacillus solimangrovi TaxID=1305675 RepID=A0A1E5LDY4_9BACI|nr:proline dehydrogenase [Bacillus solimangrovi]OEH92270.1 proline dehydrogenase [Bacillus solimangrovi]
MKQLMRDFFLFMSQNKMFTSLAKKYGLRFGASRFVSGETIDKTVEVIKELNQKGMDVTIDYLGEFVDNENEAKDRTEETIRSIHAIADEGLHSQVSLKLTSMGLDISNELVMANMRRIMEVANYRGVFITIDMEDYSRLEQTLTIFKQLKEQYGNIGTVIQAYLYRTEGDIDNLNDHKPNLRLVKGAYKESPNVAFPVKKDVDGNFKKIIKMHLLNGNYTAVATHDDQIIEYTKQLVKEHNISNEQFEFQMLYGIRVERQEELVKEGYKMRVYVPYGNDWYGYFMRRLAERPANVVFVLKGTFNK